MNIYFITSKLNFKKSGGSIEEIDLMIRDLINLGNTVTVVTAFSYMNDMPSDLPYKVITENIKARGLLGIQYGGYRLLKKYSKHAEIFHIDGHLFLYSAGIYRLFGGKVPVVAFFNQYLIPWLETSSSLFTQRRENTLNRTKRLIRWYIEKYFGIPLANHIDRFSFVSPTLRSVYEEYGLRKDPKTLVIGDLIDYDKIMRENGITEDFYRMRNKQNGPVTIFYSSRMAPNKGFDMMLAAFAILKNKNNFQMILGGTGPEELFVRKMAKDLNIEKFIIFPGWVTKEKLYEHYKTADIFVQPEWRKEGTSISLLYAMAFGVPSIVPGGGGLEWQAGASALCYEKGNKFDLAVKIEQLGNDYFLRATLSQNCYKRIRDDEMNHAKQVPRLNGLMKDLVEAY